MSPLVSARQHPSYGDCLKVKKEYYQNHSVLDCVTQCSQSAALISAVITGPTDWVCHTGIHAVRRGGFLELIVFIVAWWSDSGGIQD